MPAAPWRVADRRKSSFSDAGNGCLEALLTDTGVELTDTKHGGAGPVVRFGLDEWRRFVAAAVDGRAAEEVRNEPLVVEYGGRAVHTNWHVGGLHFTDHEWDAFRRGVAAGEFTPAR